MDEFGSRIQHSDQPSFATAPLFYMPQQIAYTVLWPLRDLETGGKCASVEFVIWGFFYAHNRRQAIFLQIIHFTVKQIFQGQNDCVFCNAIKFKSLKVHNFCEIDTLELKNFADVLLTENLNLASLSW